MGATTSVRKRASSVRHTRAVQRDRQTQPTLAPSAAPVEAWLHELIHPATLAQVAAYRQLGLRERQLTLPVMVAFVVSLIWRQLGSVSEAVRVLRAEGLLWVGPTAVSQQALSLRLRRFPPSLFERVLLEVLPQAQARWQARQRPLPPLLQRLRGRFTAVLALDGSTLDAVLHKTGLLRDQPGGVLGGRIAAVLDVASMLPRQVWYEADQHANDLRFWDRAVTQLPVGSLALFDGGFLNYAHYDDLGARGVTFLTRAGTKMAYRVTAVLQQTPTLRDRLVAVGAHPQHRCARPLRLIEVRVGQTWYRYLTNALDPAQLAATEARAVYALRWSIERAFLLAKRLLGLAYLWTGAANGVLTQVWATWLLYAALTDLCDAVADALHLPAERISVELTYRALYHFTQAFHRGEATEVVPYLAAHATTLSLRKRPRRPPSAPLTPPDDP